MTAPPYALRRQLHAEWAGFGDLLGRFPIDDHPSQAIRGWHGHFIRALRTADNEEALLASALPALHAIVRHATDLRPHPVVEIAVHWLRHRGVEVPTAEELKREQLQTRARRFAAHQLERRERIAHAGRQEGAAAADDARARVDGVFNDVHRDIAAAEEREEARLAELRARDAAALAQLHAEEADWGARNAELRARNDLLDERLQRMDAGVGQMEADAAQLEREIQATAQTIKDQDDEDDDNAWKEIALAAACACAAAGTGWYLAKVPGGFKAGLYAAW